MPVSIVRFVANLARRGWAGLLPVLLAAGFPGSPVAAESYTFGVVAQRNAVLTARYWNPILAHAGARAGVELVLKVARSGGDSAAAAERGEYDFVYSNHIFQPNIAAAGYRVILRPRDEPITGQIVVAADSGISGLKDLAGREVGFPSASAFVGYALPMDRLRHEGVGVTAVFGGNQEGTMAQLKAGRVAAAGVNGKLMRVYAEREGFRYRVLWESAPYHDIPIAVHPRVPAAVAAAVREALAGMSEHGEGRAVLEEAANVVGQKPPYGFVAATPAEYRNYVDFYRSAKRDAP